MSVEWKEGGAGSGGMQSEVEEGRGGEEGEGRRERGGGRKQGGRRREGRGEERWGKDPLVFQLEFHLAVSQQRISFGAEFSPLVLRVELANVTQQLLSLHHQTKVPEVT